jgi:epoxyqueuosine reductase
VSDTIVQIKSAALQKGFDIAGIASVDPLHGDDQHYREWLESGFAAGMGYMSHRRDLFAKPRLLVTYAHSLISLAVNYYSKLPEFQHESRYGRVARYAWGRDYHHVVKTRLEQLVSAIEQIAGRALRARCFVDAVPLLERAAAARAGLGFFGKNTNLLRPQGGSWFFLSEILIDLELPPDLHASRVSCGTCQRCLDACPTDAFAEPYVLDSNRCISYLTIENKDEIPRPLRAGLGEWLFGCDVCQDVCPFNRFSSQTRWPELEPEAGAGQRLAIADLLRISSDEEFRARFRGTPLLRPKRKGLLRNAAVVAANIGCVEAVPALVERVEQDPEPLIRSHALWALERLDSKAGMSYANKLREHDPNQVVREEARAVLEGR